MAKAKTKAKTKAKPKPKSKKRVAAGDALVEKDHPNVHEATNVYNSFFSLSMEQRGSVCLLLKKLDPSCFVATGDVIGEYALHCIDFTNISPENLNKVKVMIDSFNVSMKIDEDEDNKDKKLPAKEKTDGNDDEEDARKPESNDADEDYTPPNNDDLPFFLAHRDCEQNHTRLLAIMTRDIASLGMGISSVTEIESSIVSSHNDLEESLNSGTSKYRGTLGGFTREDNGKRVYRADMAPLDMAPLSSRGSDNTVLAEDPVPFARTAVTNEPSHGGDNTMLHVSAEAEERVPPVATRLNNNSEHARMTGIMASDLQDICRDNNSFLCAFDPICTNILNSLKTSKDSTNNVTNLGKYMIETEAQQLDEYHSRNGSAAIANMNLSDVNLSQTRHSKLTLSMGYNSHSTRIDGIDTTSITDIGGHMIATLDLEDLRKFSCANGIILGYNPLRWECVFAIETAKSLQTNGDLGPYTTSPMLASVEDATVLITHFLIRNLASSKSVKVSRFMANKKAAVSMETPLFWEDCERRSKESGTSRCNRCGDSTTYECTRCNTAICCPVGKGNECFNEHHKSMHHEQHDESERMATLVSQAKKKKCVVCGKKDIYWM